MHMDMSEEAFCGKFTGKMPNPYPGASILYEPAQSKWTWTCHKRIQEAFCAEIYRENAKRFRYHLDWITGLNTYHKNPSVWPHCLGNNGKIIIDSDSPSWSFQIAKKLSCKIQKKNCCMFLLSNLKAKLRVLLLPGPGLAHHLRSWRASHGAGNLDVLPALGLRRSSQRCKDLGGFKGSKDPKIGGYWSSSSKIQRSINVRSITYYDFACAKLKILVKLCLEFKPFMKLFLEIFKMSSPSAKFILDLGESNWLKQHLAIFWDGLSIVKSWIAWTNMWTSRTHTSRLCLKNYWVLNNRSKKYADVDQKNTEDATNSFMSFHIVGNLLVAFLATHSSYWDTP